MAKGDDLEARLIDFAVSVIRISEALPGTPAYRHIRGPLLRSCTSPAPNYAEARGAESNRDFIHKLKIALKELNESRVWLKMLIRSEIVTARQVADALEECEQLCRIISASIRTSRQSNK